jgi:alpha-2-macroglobulin-like protein
MLLVHCRWLSSVCDGGRYGSTQDTVLALKAILAYETKRAAAMVDSEVSTLQ